MSDLENVYKSNRYFYIDSNQNILRYKNKNVFIKIYILKIILKK